MADPIVIAGLKDKTHELRQAIVTYEERLERTRKELAVVTATLTIMERDGGRLCDARPAAIRNLFTRGEPLRLCKAALAAEPEMTSRALAVACLAARGFDHEDPVLVRSMVGVLSGTLKQAVRRKEMVKVDYPERKVAWRLAWASRS